MGEVRKIVYYNFTEEELRAICRANIETLEMWAHRLIHEKMVEKYGKDYVDKIISGNYLRPSHKLCKPPMWCRIGAPHWRFYYEQQKESTYRWRSTSLTEKMQQKTNA